MSEYSRNTLRSTADLRAPSTYIRKSLFWIFGLFFVLLCTLNSIAYAQDRIVVEVGKGILLPRNQLTESVFVADTNIADVNSSPGESVFVFGKAVGETSLIASSLDGGELFRYNVVVTHSLSEIRSMLSRRFPGEAVSVSSSRGSIYLTGAVSSDRIRRNIEASLAGSVPDDTIINELIVGSADLIQLRVRVLEINRSRAENFGIDWNATIASNGYYIGAQDNGEIGFGRDDSVGTSVDATVDLLISNGFGTVVQETSLSTISGENADFSVGSEIPVPTFIDADSESSQTPNFSLDYKFIGTDLTFSPEKLNNNRLRLAINSNISAIQENASTATVNGNVFPNLNSRSFSTTVDLADRQSFVIAGLSRNENRGALRDAREGFGSGLINGVFGRDRVSGSNLELVIIVTPIFSHLEERPVSAELFDPISNLEFILTHPGQSVRRIVGPAGFSY